MTDELQIELMDIMGTNKNTQILNLLLPLDERTEVTIPQIVKALGSKESVISRHVQDLVSKKILVHIHGDIYSLGGREGTYSLNNKSRRVLALRNVLFAMYIDAAKHRSEQRLGLEGEKDNRKEG